MAPGIRFRRLDGSLEPTGAQGALGWQRTEMLRASRQFRKASPLSFPGGENAAATGLPALVRGHLPPAGSELDGDRCGLGPWSDAAHPLDEEIDGCNIFTTWA